MKRVLELLLAALVLAVVAGSYLLTPLGQGSYRFVDADQPSQGTGLDATLEPGTPLGQTFVARHGGLAGVEFYLIPNNLAPLTLTLHLRSEPEASKDLATGTLQLAAAAAPGFYRFAFPSIAVSHGQYHYAFLEALEPGASVALASGDAYLDGAAYQDHQPLDAQTSFRLVYLPRDVVLDMLKPALAGMGLLAVAGLLFVVPGWALLAWLWPGRPLSWPEMLGLSVGVSLALYPLLLLWTDVIGLHLGALYAWLPVVAGLLALVWRYRTWRPRAAWQAFRRWARSETLWPDFTLVVVLALVFGVRLLVVRTLDAPMWGDSYHHTMIAQLLVDHGGLFGSWEPYAAIDRFTYHFGFHSTVAVLHWITGLPVVKATLWTGQLLNGLAVLVLYPLAVRVTRSRWGGVWAVLLAGLLSPMPMFYVNWGRFTQLAGQVILPAAVWLTWEVVDSPRRPYQPLVLVVLAVGGLALTHYRVLLFYAAFVLALVLLSLGHGAWRRTLLRLSWACAGAGLLFLPWFVNAFGGSLLHSVGQQLTTPPSQAHPFSWEYNAVGSLETYLAPVWWLALLLGLGVGLWRRQRGALLVGLWWFVLLICTNPAWLSLPGTGIITNFALFIAAYLPSALLSGVVAAHLSERAARRRWAIGAGVLLLLGLGAWGARERLGDAAPADHALVTRPDVRAAEWIDDNLSPEARLLVNSFFAYGGNALVGSDGGWWLPLLAERQTTVPPATYNSDVAQQSAYRQRIHNLAQQVQQFGPGAPATLALFQQEGVTHVYVGQGQGRLDDGGSRVLDPHELERSPHYRVVYHQDRVWIFAVTP